MWVDLRRWLDNRFQEVNAELTEVTQQKNDLTDRYQQVVTDHYLLSVEVVLIQSYISFVHLFVQLSNLTDQEDNTKALELLVAKVNKTNNEFNLISSYTEYRANRRVTGYVHYLEDIHRRVSELRDHVILVLNHLEETSLFIRRLELLDGLQNRGPLPLPEIMALLLVGSRRELLSLLAQLPRQYQFQIEDQAIRFDSTHHPTPYLPEFDIQLSEEAGRFSVRCSGHRERKTLYEAYIEGWVICRHCHAFFCPTCGDSLVNCPNLAQDPHRLDKVGLPIEALLKFTRKVDNATVRTPRSDITDDVVWLTRSKPPSPPPNSSSPKYF